MGSPGQRYNSLCGVLIAFFLPFVCSILVLLLGMVIHCTKVRWVGGIRRVIVVGRIFKTPFPFPFSLNFLLKKKKKKKKKNKRLPEILA